ncbi:MAG TPA: HEAT repeat domain-containing protein [Tepidisphaeraceae bacterium]|jgi:HEAT repeat protein/thiol-disulfide isomerase/thioredoxin
MKTSHRSALLRVALLGSAGTVGVTSPGAAQTQSVAPTTAPASFTWLDTLDAGYKDAMKHQRPILVVFGADWCAPCRELQKVMDLPDIRDKLTTWTRVHIDVDKPEAGATPFAGPIPTLRILNAQGKLVAERAGYLPGDSLARWLAENLPAAGIVDPDLAGTDAPDAPTTARLVAKLGGSDASASEAAIKRLLPWPDVAGSAVAEAFSRGNLRKRLATLDLLGEWGAPVNQIDPWEPSSVTAARIESIRKWAGLAKKTPPTATTVPSASVLDAAKEDLASLQRGPAPGEASAIIDRLARAGPALLPEVYTRLKKASSESERQRLSALRYRLVSTDALSLQWTGGLERLASSDAQVRREAAEELAHRATTNDQRLLVELFNDPDPLIREISLRGLQTLGGAGGNESIIRLLKDPVENVRAAVLKQLAESPSPQSTDAVVKYIASETDPDLVVHAVRVLRASKNGNAINCLIRLLGHESWRVRAEAIDALATIYQEREGAPPVPQDQIAAAVTKLLDDSDGFVTGRAMAAMKALASGQSAQLLVDAAKRRPELTLEVVKMLADTRHQDPAFVNVLRQFSKNDNPAVRAIAVRGVASLAPKNCDAETLAALKDQSAEVRVAGAEALVSAMEQLRPTEGYINRPSFFGMGGGRVKVDPNEWIDKFRAGSVRPSWMGQILPDLRAMLKSTDPNERNAAAMPLAMLGDNSDAMAILVNAAKVDATARQSATRLIPWLPWDQRLRFFNAIAAMANDDHTLAALAEQMSQLKDRRSAEPLWQLLANTHSNSLAGPIYSALNQIYLGENMVSGDAPLTTDTKAVVEVAKGKITSGSDDQKLVALALLLGVSGTDAAEQARQIYENPKTPATFKTDAFHVLLLAQPKPDAQRLAIGALSATGPKERSLSLTFLASGPGSIQSLRDSIYISNVNISEDMVLQSGQTIKLDPPPGLDAKTILPLLSGANRDDAAMAGYLACLMGKREGLAPLVEYWKTRRNQRWDPATRLLYRAISALDDDGQTPLLEQIYSGFEKQDFSIREFYWTIRSMHGSQILKLRKKIRDEVGMQRLQ